MIDPLRGTGRTTKQMLAAPVDAVFVSCHAGALYHDWGLAQKHGRIDLKIVAPSWLTSYRWRGMLFSGIVIDHDAHLTQHEQSYLKEALTRVRTTK